MSIEIQQKINELHLEDMKNPLYPSNFIRGQGYDILILKFPTLQNHCLQTFNLVFVLDKEGVYEYDFEKEQIAYLSQDYMLMYQKIDTTVDATIQLLEVYSEEVSQMEETLYSKAMKKKFIDLWFELKKDLSRLERIFLKSYLVIKYFVKQSENDEGFLYYKFLDIQDNLDRAQKTVSLNLSKLDTIYNYHQSLKNDKLNNTLYSLTIISAIFLPLNLLVGFFGMNTTGMFFTQESGGTIKVIYLLVLTILVIVVAFPLIMKIYEKTFGRFLNRYEFYKKLTKKIKEIND